MFGSRDLINLCMWALASEFEHALLTAYAKITLEPATPTAALAVKSTAACNRLRIAIVLAYLVCT